jgi:hypothetical protein
MDLRYVLFDNSVVCWLYNNYTGITFRDAEDNPEEAWSFFFNRKKINKLRNDNWEFKHSCRTDGVGIVLLFEGSVPKHKKKKKAKAKKKKKKEEDAQKKPRKRHLKPLEQHHLKPGFVSEKEILEHHKGYDTNNIRMWSVDPGVRNLAAVVNLQSGTTFQISQTHYKHSTQGRYPKQQQVTEELKQRRASFAEALCKAPFRKTVMLERLAQYLNVVNHHWATTWQIAKQRKYRRNRFERAKHQQAFIDDTLNLFRKHFASEPDKKHVLLWGNGGGGKNGFMRVRGGGVKGPVLKIKRLLAKEFPIICCSEYRTSKCCLRCGHVLQHPKRLLKLPRTKKRRKKFHLNCRIPPKENELVDVDESSSDPAEVKRSTTTIDNGVSHCLNPAHHSFVNRDYDASFKIGLRFVAQLCGAAIGAWSYQVEAADLNNKKWPQLFNFAKTHFPDGLHCQSGRKLALVPIIAAAVSRG